MKIFSASAYNNKNNFAGLKIYDEKKLHSGMVKVINEAFLPVILTHDVIVTPVFSSSTKRQPDFQVVVTKKASGLINKIKALFNSEQCFIQSPSKYDGGAQFKIAAEHFVKSIIS